MNLKKIVAFVLIISIFLTIVPFNAFAAEYFETNRDEVPVWSQATEYSTLVRTIVCEGTVVETTKRVKNIFGNYWYKVSGGYIYSGNLRKHTNHSAVACSLDSTTYEKLDSKNHTVIVETGEEVCFCGKVMVEAKVTRTTQAHTMSNGKCTKCNYQKHVHKESKTVNKSSTYEQNDAESHIYVQYSGDKVCSCGKVMSEGKYTRVKQMHIFVGNKCQKCNYEKDMHVHHRDKTVNESSNYYTIDNETHKLVRYTGDVYCQCGELVSKGEHVEKIEKHKFSRDTCTICNHERPHVHVESRSGKSNVTYEDRTEDTHTKVVKAPDKYCWCDKLLSTGKITRTVEKHLFVGNKCSVCNYEKTLHVHQQHTWKNKSTKTEAIDEYRHKTIEYTGDIYCWCDVLVSYGRTNETIDNHSFDGDICTVCKYEREHVHSFYRYDGKQTVEYVDITVDSHTKVVRTPDQYCRCNAKISTGKTTRTTERHLFIGNKCSTCGFEKNIHIHDRNNYIHIATEYEAYNEYVHDRIEHSGEIRCSCKELIEPDKTTVYKDPHIFEDNVCVYCGYKREVHIHSVGYTRNASMSYGENEYLCHNIIEYSGDEYCSCNQYMGEGRYTYRKEAHDFDINDKCTICGYIRVRTESEKVLEQVLFGEFSDEVTTTGTALQIVIGETPIIGTAFDLRDLLGSIANYESPVDVALNAVAFLPLGGALKYSDEVAVVLKNADEVVYAVENIDEINSIVRVYVKNGDEVTEVVTVIASSADEAEQIVRGLNLHSVANSNILRNNMRRVGIVEPDYPNAAHHIVAGGHRYSDEARAILEHFEININHPSNGVFLPWTDKDLDAVYHPSMHTREYFEKVTELLKEADSKEEALEILESIGVQLQNGTFFDD